MSDQPSASVVPWRHYSHLVLLSQDVALVVDNGTLPDYILFMMVLTVVFTAAWEAGGASEGCTIMLVVLEVMFCRYPEGRRWGGAGSKTTPSSFPAGVLKERGATRITPRVAVVAKGVTSSVHAPAPCCGGCSSTQGVLWAVASRPLGL